MTLRDAYLQRTYGITEAGYKAMLEYQNSRCALCGKHKRQGRKRWICGIIND